MKSKSKAKAHSSEPTFTNLYLMWVGSDSYPGIEDWSSEAISLGISKRLPSIDVGRALMRPGTAIFVAHDEGETDHCAHCLGKVECPDCRKRAVERTTLNAAIAVVQSRYVTPEAAAKGDYSGWETLAAAGDITYVARRQVKLDELDSKDASCVWCGGAAEYETGTGGHVVLDDGSIWDYRRYNYWLHQPKKFDPSWVLEKHMCEACGGTGEMPRARVFGVFVPERIEYVLGEGDIEDEARMAAVKGMELIPPEVLTTEVRRGCGYRKPGGVYAVTSTVGVPEMTRAALDELIEKKLVKPEAASIHGNFISFEKPIMVAEKRFRGIKSIDLSILGSVLADDVEMVMDAIAV